MKYKEALIMLGIAVVFGLIVIIKEKITSGKEAASKTVEEFFVSFLPGWIAMVVATYTIAQIRSSGYDLAYLICALYCCFSFFVRTAGSRKRKKEESFKQKLSELWLDDSDTYNHINYELKKISPDLDLDNIK